MRETIEHENCNASDDVWGETDNPGALPAAGDEEDYLVARLVDARPRLFFSRRIMMTAGTTKTAAMMRTMTSTIMVKQLRMVRPRRGIWRDGGDGEYSC